MDAIELLKQDHRTVEELFAKFDAAGRRAFKTKRKLVDRIVEELSVHAVIEEQVFYPAAREAASEARGTVLESLEEHHIVKWTLSELDGMDPKDERFDAKVRVLAESVRRHVKEEERDLFRQVRKVLRAPQLRELGERLAEAKAAAPTRPHPRAPDTPPGNLVAGPAAAVMDAGREVASQMIESARGGNGEQGGSGQGREDAGQGS